MKTFCLSTIFLSFLLLNINSLFAQNTFIPDDNFEQALIDLGYDSGSLNDSVPATSIKNVKYLNVIYHNIKDLTGIEFFTSLQSLYCHHNQITKLDLSKNLDLGILDCRNNVLNQISLSNNNLLKTLLCSYNELIDLDLSSNPILSSVNCDNNKLSGLNIRNGNNSNLQLNAGNNPDLLCIEVDDEVAAYNYTYWIKNLYTAYTNDCSNYVIEMGYVPDDNFENELIKSKLDFGPPNDSVPLVAMKYRNYLEINYKGIKDLTGIEHFKSLTSLQCNYNQIVSLDLSFNHSLIGFYCIRNPLTSLNLKNGNNQNMTVDVRYNDDLFCIEVDDSIAAYSNKNWEKNPFADYTKECSQYKMKMIYLPDDNFEQVLINLRCDFGTPNDSVPFHAVSRLKYLDLAGYDINDLTGIENFISLENLRCDFNKIKKITTSNMPQLKELSCGFNQIMSLDLSNNSNLSRLSCNKNNLNSLNLTTNHVLSYVNCDENQITSLNLQNGNNSNMMVRSMFNPGLYCIQVDDPTASNSFTNWLKDAYTDYSVDCSAHFVEMTYVPDDNFEQALIELGYDSGALDDSVATIAIEPVKTIMVGGHNISDLTGIEDFISLEVLYCNNNNISEINLSKNTKLKNLLCHHNKISTLDLSNNVLLTNLSCYNNILIDLDLRENQLLTNLDVRYNQLSGLNIQNGNNSNMYINASDNPNLYCIQVDDEGAAYSYPGWHHEYYAIFSEDCSNYIMERTYVPDDNFEQALIDMGLDSGELDDSVLTANIKSVINLNIANKNISDLTGIEYFESLTSLICSLNQLTKLNLNKNKKLDYLECGSNNLDSLNLDSLNLTHISCSYNNLSQLEIKNCTDLIYLYCPFNSLKTIDLSNNKLLKELTISSNKLIDLDLSLHTDLSKVFLFDNELTMLNLQNGSNQSISSLDVSNNPNLSCIQIDNVQEANSFVDWYKDSWANYSEDCSKQDIRKTYIPDDNFEQALIDLGYDSGELDDSVLTVNIENVSALYIENKNIGDLTGIEDFENLSVLNCTNNRLTILDLSKNQVLKALYCFGNDLYTLNIKNGNNINMTGGNGRELIAFLNPNLTCIQVDDAVAAETYSDWKRDTWACYTENCESGNERIPTSEYEALVALYNATDGNNWSYNNNWLDTINHVVDDWYGITVENGHVTQIYLDHTNTLGFIPKEFGNLTELRKLHLRYCGLSGGIPVELSNLKKLAYLNLSDGHLGPQFIDGVPNQVRCIPDELENLDSLTYFNIDINKFMFNDIEAVYSWKNFNNFKFIYRAQYTSTMGYNEVWVEPGKDIVISIYDYIASPSDQYQWVKDNVWISGANSRTLELKNVQLSDEGSYYCRITNSVAQEATISSSSTDLKVKGLLVAGVPQSEYNSLVDLYFSTQGENWATNTNWLDATRSVDTWFGITVEDGHVTQIQLNNNNLQDTAFDEMIRLPKLKWLDLSNNKLTGFNFQGTDSLVSLDSFMIYNNQLIFEDLIPAFSTLNYPNFSKQFNYSPQAKIATIENIIKMTDENFSVEIAQQFLSPNDQFQWYKEYSPLEGETNSGIDFFPVSTSDSGSYHLQITNPYVPNLTLYSEFIHIRITNSLIDSLLLFDLTHKYPQLKTIWDNNDPFSTWPGVTFENGKVTTLNLSGLQLEGDFSSFFTDFDSLKWLDLSNNKLSGEFPKIGAINNSTIKSNGSNNQNLKYLDISNNNFVFAELEPAFDFFKTIDTFIYAPQSMVGLSFDTTIYKNQPLTFKIANYTPGSFDRYSWSKDGTEITDANEFTFAIKNAAPGDSGYYTCAITNLLFPELTLLSDTSRLNVLIPVGIDDFNNTHFNIFPNPAEKQIFVDTGNTPVNLKLFDITGTLIFGKDDFMSAWINIEPFTSGIYFVRITSQNSETITKKVIFK